LNFGFSALDQEENVFDVSASIELDELFCENDLLMFDSDVMMKDIGAVHRRRRVRLI
jgi:hypothetical protein